VALRKTQPKIEMGIRNISGGRGGGKGGRWVGVTTLLPSCADCLEILGISTPWSPKGLSRSMMGKLYIKIYDIYINIENKT
jgi:hypothetical protein